MTKGLRRLCFTLVLPPTPISVMSGQTILSSCNIESLLKNPKQSSYKIENKSPDTSQDAKTGERWCSVVGEDRNSTTFPQILDFIFTVNVHYKKRWPDFSAFVGFEAPSLPPPAAAHPAEVWGRLKTTLQPDVISNSWDIKTLKNGVCNGNADRLLTIAALL